MVYSKANNTFIESTPYELQTFGNIDVRLPGSTNGTSIVSSKSTKFRFFVENRLVAYSDIIFIYIQMDVLVFFLPFCLLFLSPICSIFFFWFSLLYGLLWSFAELFTITIGIQFINNSSVLKENYLHSMPSLLF